MSRNEKGSDWQGRRVDHADFASRLTDSRQAADKPDLPRNIGTRRTDSKRALLAAIEATGKIW